MRVEVLDPPRALAIRIADQNWAWIFALVPEGGSTRLLFMEPGSLVMERKMLLGIKRRAERH